MNLLARMCEAESTLLCYVLDESKREIMEVKE